MSQHQDSKTSPAPRGKIGESGSSDQLSAGAHIDYHQERQQPGSPLPFVDRTKEMEKLHSFIDALTGVRPEVCGGGLFFISGQAGIGKTRLASELSSYARERKVRWLSARCVRGALELVPYSPWVDLIRSFVVEAQVPLFYRVCADSVSEIVQLLPELTVDNPMNKPPAPPSLFSDPEVAEQYNRKFFQAIADFFVRLSRESPLILVIDDMQWIDPASLRLLNYMVLNNMLHSPIGVIAIFRDSDLESENSAHLTAFIANLEQQGMLVSPDRFLRLGRLGFDDVGKLVSARFAGIKKTGSAVLQTLVERIYERTGGNPYFVVEVLRSLIEQGSSCIDGEQQSESLLASNIMIPNSIRNLLYRRLSSLDADSIEFLEIASVIGDDFDLDLIQTVSGWEERQIISCSEKALKANLLLQETTDNHRRGSSSEFSFADESVKDILYERITPKRRREYHLKIARVAEDEIRSSTGDDRDSASREATTRAAFHFLQADDAESAIRYYLLAGDNARSVYARQIAADSYQMSVDLLRSRLASTRSRALREETKDMELMAASTLRKLAEELEVLGQTLPVIDARLEAAQIFESHDEFKAAGDLYAKAGFVCQMGLYDRVSALQNYSRASDALAPAGESVELAYLYVYIGVIYMWDGDREKTIETMMKALDLAIKLNAHSIQAMALHLGPAMFHAGEKERALEQVESGLKIALEHQCYRELSFLYFDRAAIYANVRGAGPKTLELFNQGIEYTSERGYLAVNFWLMGELAFEVLLPLGDWQKARVIAEKLFAASKNMPPTSLLSLIASSTLGHVYLSVGELDKSEELLANVKSRTKGWGLLQLRLPPYTGLARIHLERGNYDRAEEYIKEGLEHGRKTGVTVGFSGYLIALLSTKVELLQRRIEATRVGVGGRSSNERQIAIAKYTNEISDVLAEIKGVVDSIDEDWARAYYNRAEGMVAASREDFASSESSFRKSIELWRKIGWPYELAKTLHAAGAVLEETEKLGESMICFEEALKIFSDLGAKIDIQRVSAARSRCAEFRKAEAMLEKLPKFSSGESRKLFDFLLREFINDYAAKGIVIGDCGWRTLSKASVEAGVPQFSLYARGGGSGHALKDCVSSRLVEARVFRGERGRGGEIIKVRIAYEREALIRELVDLRLGRR